MELQEAAEQESVLKGEKDSLEAQLESANQKIEEDRQDQAEKLTRQDLSLVQAEKDTLKNERLVELETANENLKRSNNELSESLASINKELTELKEAASTAASSFDDLKNEYEQKLEEQWHQASEDFNKKMRDMQNTHDEVLNSMTREKIKAEKKLIQEQSARQRDVEELRASNQREVEELRASNQREIEKLRTLNQIDLNKSDSRASALEETINSLKVAEHKRALESVEQGQNDLRAGTTQLQNEAEQLKLQEQLDEAKSATRKAQAAHTTADELYQEALRKLSQSNASCSFFAHLPILLKMSKAAKDAALKKLADEQKRVITVQSSYQSLESSYQTCQGDLEALRQDANAKIAEATSVIKKYMSDLKQSKEQVYNAENSLKEKLEEIVRLQGEVARLKTNSNQTASQPAPAAAPSHSVPEPVHDRFPASRQTLNRARVTEELRRATEAKSSSRNASRPRYRLGSAIPTVQFPWGNHEPSQFTKAGRKLREAGQGNPDSDLDGDGGDNGVGGRGNDRRDLRAESQNESSNEDEDSDDKMGERDDHVVHRKWERMAIKKRYTQQQQNINCSRLARELVLACLGSKHLFEVFARDQVDDERVTNFHGDPTTYGPRLRNSRLDKRGTSTQQILDESRWNQTLMHNLANEAAIIFASSPDKHFGEGPEDGWYKMIRVHIQPVLKTHLEALPRFPGEPLRERIQQVARRYEKIKEFNKHNNILHSKYHVRASVGAIMAQALHQKGDNEGEEMWQYVLRCLSWLEHDGMSDEEEGSELVTIDGRQSTIQVRKVKKLFWRHPSLHHLFEMVDRTREVEASIFSHQGRPPMKRICVDEGPTRERPPPKHLPVSFFDPGYLQEIRQFPYQIENLRLSKNNFALREVPNLPDFEGQ
ncbi:hypothetical protein VKT23_016153 [Stygiomarasmius scandens]|uniref:Uncharacterized protein n=1 Tax=Marasmiellus scandens TaxID=2682957 RepID=A0ABR1IVW7_9AGAR